MTDKNKSGIRLRHLQQLQQQKYSRDLSPGAANRKKIFQKLPYQKVSARQVHEDKPKPIKIGDTERQLQFEKLVQNLKRKSMQVELRDNMIQSLNKQIDELKRELRSKQQEIDRLNDELKKMDKFVGDSSKQSKGDKKTTTVFDSFRDPIQPSYMPPPPPFVQDPPQLQEPSLFIQQPPTFLKEVPQNFVQESNRREQNSFAYKKDEPEVQSYGFGNQNYNTPNYGSSSFGNNNYGGNNYNNYDRKPSNSILNQIDQEPQILSPFMALTNKRADTPPKTVYQPFSRGNNQPFQGQIITSLNQNFGNTGNIYSNTSKSAGNPFDNYNPQSYNNTSHSSSFSKKPGQFDIFKDRRASGEVDKFNLFGGEKNNQVRPQTKLTIEDSRQFKFQDFSHSDF